MADFTEYKNNPGFWFAIQLVIGAIVSEDPELKAKNRPFTEKDVIYVENWIKISQHYKHYYDRLGAW